MVGIPSDNIRAVVARECYFLLRPKIELFSNSSVLFENRGLKAFYLFGAFCYND